MSFWLDKCEGRKVDSSGIELPGDQHIRRLRKRAADIWEFCNWIRHSTKMKGKVTAEYIDCVDPN